MEKMDTTGSKLTRQDKAHQKFMDKLDTFKDGLIHGLDSLKSTHKQTLDSSSEYATKIIESQKDERSELYAIIKTCEDETKRKEAYERLRELDRIKDEEIENHNRFLQSERDTANKNITGGIICLAVVSGLMTNKQLRQMTGKVLSLGKNMLLKG